MKRMSFPLIVAMALATSAHAEKGQASNGRGIGNAAHIAPDTEQHAKGDLASAQAKLFQASYAYKKAWNHPEKSILLAKLNVYYDAALHVQQIQGASGGTAEIRKYFSEEMERIEKHFDGLEDISKLEDRFGEALAKMRVIDNSQSIGKMYKTLDQRYEKAKRIYAEIKDVTGESRWEELRATYDEVVEVIDQIKQRREFEANKHQNGVEKVAGSGSAEIDTHGTCKVVTNANGARLFVSTNTKGEWNGDKGFLQNLPEGVSAKDCPPPPSSGGGKDKVRNYQQDGYKFGKGEESWKDHAREERDAIGRGER